MKSYKNRISILKKIASEARYLAVKSVINSGVGHLGGSLSCIDILTVLYFDILNISKSNLNDPNRNRFILSKGHSSIGLYSVLALKGIIDTALLSTFRMDGSILSGHPEAGIPGIEHGTGSLGQGLSVGVGMALAAKIDKKSFMTFVLLGDGELQEGQVWEAAMAGAHYKLDNLVAIVDRNRLQIDGLTDKIMNLGDIKAKWQSFGWILRSVDGHSFLDLLMTIHSIPFGNKKPIVIIADTIKGKGVSFMENQVKWHGGAPKGREAENALKQLKENIVITNK